MESQIKVGLVYGSTRPGRFCDTIARWAAGQVAAREGFTLETIDPAAAESLGAPELKRRIAACDAFLRARVARQAGRLRFLRRNLRRSARG